MEKEKKAKEDIKKEVKEEITEVEESVNEDMVEKMIEKAMEKMGLNKQEKVEQKELGEKTDKIDKVSKEMELVNYIKTLQTTTTYDDLIPPKEFIAEVARLEEEYGVSLRDARVYRTNRTSVQVPKKTADLVVYDTSEGVAKTESTPTFDSVEVTLKKWAAIAPLTDELGEDAAVNIWQELTTSFARAFAKKADEIVFTDAIVGLTKISGTKSVTLDAAEGYDDVTFDDLIEAIYSVSAAATQGAKFYLHRSALKGIQKIKDGDNNYIWSPGPNGVVGGSIWGYPYELVEVLPDQAAVQPSTGFMVFGNLKNYMLLVRTEVQLTVLKEGTVGSVNLGEQDAQALRGVKRMYGKAIFPDAFCVIKTNTTIS